MKNKVLFILLSFSLCFPLIAVSQNTHRENGWYHVIDNKKDSLSIEPILTVNDFATLELDTSNLGQYAIFGQISQQKIKKWAIETEKAIGKQIAFVFNDSIITSPQVNAKIESGAFVITSSSDKKLPQLYKQIIENKLYSCGITYRNGYILNKKGEIIGNYSNGYICACLLVTEAGAPFSKADEELIRRFQGGKIPAVLAINKIDLLEDKSVLMEQIAQYAGRYDFQAVVPVSARDGSGMEDLLSELKGLCMPGGHLFPEDTLTDQPERVIAGELVREKTLRLLDKEVPHGVAAVTERMKDRDGILDIDVTLYCEKPGHKGILIGKGGAMLKKIGTAARQDLERFFGCKVNLQLWVKVKEDWRQRPETLQSLGFSERDLEL